MIESKKFKNIRTGEIVTQFSIMDIEFMEEVKEEKEIKSRKKDLVVYNLGSNSLHTLLFDDGFCCYSNKKYDLNDKRIMNFKKASKLIDEVQNKKYIKPFVEISKDKYYEMLECLPPVKFTIIDEFNELFFMSERTEGVFTSVYVKFNNKYYNSTRSIFLKPFEVFIELSKQLNYDFTNDFKLYIENSLKN